MSTTEPAVATEASAIATRILPGELFAAECPSRAVLQHVTIRWSELVLVALLAGTHHFSHLRRKIDGVSEKLLAQTLQWLEGYGFVLRTRYPVVVPHVEGLAKWIEGNLSRILSGWRERADALAAQPLPGVRSGVRNPA